MNAPIVGITATANQKGYYLVGSDGGVFTFGDAQFFGSLASLRLSAPIVGMAVTTTGAGYYLVGSTARCTPSETQCTPAIWLTNWRTRPRHR